jgi:CheY-like chemotaxis protein
VAALTPSSDSVPALNRGTGVSACGAGSRGDFRHSETQIRVGSSAGSALRGREPDHSFEGCLRVPCATGDGRAGWDGELQSWLTGSWGALLRNAEDDSTRTVLVADDEPAIRELIRTVLERHGHRVLEASSAAEIFQVLDAERPDVLLLDVHLGTDDGLAIGTGLRQERQYAELKIIFMSGTAERREIIRLSELWGVSILLKPFELDALVDAVG